MRTFDQWNHIVNFQTWILFLRICIPAFSIHPFLLPKCVESTIIAAIDDARWSIKVAFISVRCMCPRYSVLLRARKHFSLLILRTGPSGNVHNAYTKEPGAAFATNGRLNSHVQRHSLNERIHRTLAGFCCNPTELYVGVIDNHQKF